jgi:hypothetical protein
MAFTTDVPLDPSLYRLDPTSLEFFKQQTGIAGEDDLKRHIFGVQAQAFAVSKECHQSMSSSHTGCVGGAVSLYIQFRVHKASRAHRIYIFFD